MIIENTSFIYFLGMFARKNLKNQQNEHGADLGWMHFWEYFIRKLTLYY